MFQHVNGSRSQLEGKVIQAPANELEIILGQHPTQIYITMTHVFDLRSLIESEDENYDGGDDE